jgi:hypothetical protein
MSDSAVVFLVYVACYGLILGYALYLHLRLRKTEE